MRLRISNEKLKLDRWVDLPVEELNRDEMISELIKYLSLEVCEIREALSALFPVGRVLDTYNYCDIERIFEEEFVSNIRNAKLDILVSFADECNNNSFIISLEETWKEFVEISYAELCEFLEACFDVFLSKSKWYAKEIEGVPTLWFGPYGKSPIDKWAIKCGEKIPEVWFSDEPWDILEYFVDEAPEGFLIWYTAERCGEIPDMESILNKCPIFLSEGDVIEVTNFKILDYICKQEGVSIELYAVCSSKKEDVSIACGTSDYEDADWFWIGMSESFWENAFEFEIGINKTKKLIETGISVEEAIRMVFGHFELSYTFNGFECSLPNNVDTDELMNDLLKQLL